ncbi:MAG: class I SAM-dependent methyltransferase [Acidobacteriaceae bacterium]|nr:class I SAM-dependent methyltransferase [Acidobacteriaceae bacterium]
MNPEIIAEGLRPEMGTESVAHILHWLARSTRAERILEVGTGYTTVLLAEALRENLHSFQRERAAMIQKSQNQVPLGAAWSLSDPPLGDPGYYLRDYRPKLLSIDNDPDASERNSRIAQIIRKLGLSTLVEFLCEDFRTSISRLRNARETFNLVWFDCGGYREYTDFLQSGWDIVDADGGLLVLHYTLTNLEIGSVIKDLKLLQATGALREFELLSILEPHKFAQNSYTILRRISQFHERVYGQPDIQMTCDVARLLELTDEI